MTEIELTAIAHGGACVGRLDGRVIFVEGGIPGEVLRVEVTDSSKKSFWRGRVVEVMRPSPHRVTPPCPIAAECGGCDFQHVGIEHQRELKRQVVAEQLQRLAGLTWVGAVKQVGEPLGWRTRMRYHRDDDGALGLRAARSHGVVPLPEGGCLIAHPAGRERAANAVGGSVTVTVASSGIAVNGVPGRVRELVHDRTYEVDSDGFWQVHPAAATTLVDAVLAGLAVRPGEVALDLYCGVGLFAGFLADAGASVVGVEGNKAAVANARRNVAEAFFHAGDVARTLNRLKPRADVVVLDPPRAGAGRAVVEAVTAMRPRKVAYVACDPASLARDLATFAERDYRVLEVRAFDLFPLTHHVECIALLEPIAAV